MLILQLILLSIIAIIGTIFNWLLILAIQRKTYYHQHSNQNVNIVTNKPLLRPHSSSIAQVLRPPLLPPIRSPMSIFDKFVLSFLINDLFVCNFLLPLRIVDIMQGLPCAFLCFMFKFIEKLATIFELIIMNLLLITSFIFFWRKNLLTNRLWLILVLLTIPILTICLTTTLTYVDINDDEINYKPPTCKQTFTYISIATHKTFNIVTCFILYFIIFLNGLLLLNMKWAVKIYKQNTLKCLAEDANSMKSDSSTLEQNTIENNRRRSMYFPAINPGESTILNMNASISRTSQSIDYSVYLSIIENSHTLVRSTSLILILYLLVHIPYCFYELTNNELLSKLKDIFLLSHIFKPFCYMLTNKIYRQHLWAILQCKTFRVSPNLSRRKPHTDVSSYNHNFNSN